MSIFDSLMETEEEERARLAQYPVGSTNHDLSKLPITIKTDVRNMVIQLPGAPYGSTQNTMIVVPIDYRPPVAGDELTESKKHKRNSGSWTCAIVASDHPSYPVGGYNVVITEAELARSKRIDLLSLMA